MTAAILSIRQLVKRFGGLIATDHVDLEVISGELHAVIGPNGAGKTTLISQIIGETAPDSGSIWLQGENVTGHSVQQRIHAGLGRTFQIVELLHDETALANVALAVQGRQGHSFHFWRNAADDRSLTDPAMTCLTDAGLGERAMVRVADLSHGEHKQLELAIALAREPAVLLLDEPMAGLGPVESAGMITRLASLKRKISIVLVEHDMEAVFALADRISVLVGGRIVVTGSPGEVQRHPETIAAYLGSGDD